MGGRGGGSGNGNTSEVAQEFKGVASNLESQAIKRKEAALRSARREKEQFDTYVAGGNVKPRPLLEAFYTSGADQKYFMAEQREARAEAIREAIKKNPRITREQIAKAEVNAAKDFANSKVSVPSSMSGRGTKKYPRVSDMRDYFDKNGNPINFSARDGGYGDIKKSWGKAYADNWKKRRYG